MTKFLKVTWAVLLRAGIIIGAVAALYAFLYAVDLVPENMKELTQDGLDWVDGFLE